MLLLLIQQQKEETAAGGLESVGSEWWDRQNTHTPSLHTHAPCFPPRKWTEQLLQQLEWQQQQKRKKGLDTGKRVSLHFSASIPFCSSLSPTSFQRRGNREFVRKKEKEEENAAVNAKESEREEGLSSSLKPSPPSSFGQCSSSSSSRSTSHTAWLPGRAKRQCQAWVQALSTGRRRRNLWENMWALICL